MVAVGPPWLVPPLGLVRIGPGEKVLIVGQTQSGKSTLASWIAAAWSRVLVLDPKLDDAIAELPGAAVRYGAAAALKALPGRVVYRPLPRELGDLAGALDPLARRIFRLGGHGLVLHETEIVAPYWGAKPGLRSLAMWGGSRHAPVIFCSQRPSRIDRLALSEPAHVFLFRLTDDRDLSTISGVMGVKPAALTPLPDPHAFYYRGPDGRVHAMRPLRLSKRNAREARSAGEARQDVR